MKPLLVGELNPYGADPEMALYPLPENASGARLQRILGLSRGEYLRRFDRVNLCFGTWSRPIARAAADLLCSAPGPRTFILLGAKVCYAFCLKYEPFTVRESPPARAYKLRYIILPHPSGRNPQWNRPEKVKEARELLAVFLQGDTLAEHCAPACDQGHAGDCR